MFSGSSIVFYCSKGLSHCSMKESFSARRLNFFEFLVKFCSRKFITEKIVSKWPRDYISHQTKVCVKINDAFYSFVCSFFISFLIFVIFGMTIVIMFVRPILTIKIKNYEIQPRKKEVKVFEPLKN